MKPAELAAAGFPVSEEIHARLARFVDLLLAENTKVNLTGIRDADAVWPLHVCDSLAIAPLIDSADASRIIDIGSGGGVPGIPLACARPELQVTLLDATRKKVAAMQRIVERLELTNVTTLWGRAETIVHEPELRESFDGLTARAVASLTVLIQFAAGLVRVGGRCWFSKSCDVKEEIAAAAPAADARRMRIAGRHVFRLPSNHGDRVIVEYEKTTAP